MGGYTRNTWVWGGAASSRPLPSPGDPETPGPERVSWLGGRKESGGGVGPALMSPGKPEMGAEGLQSDTRGHFLSCRWTFWGWTVRPRPPQDSLQQDRNEDSVPGHFSMVSLAHIHASTHAHT